MRYQDLQPWKMIGLGRNQEFTPSFSTDLAVPPDEFPDLVHPDSNHSNSSCDVPQSHSDGQSVRQSTRVRKPPSYLQDYHCNLASAHVSTSVSLPQSDASIAPGDTEAKGAASGLNAPA
nr:hypothetical protein CFP56_71153 [Quercus suber]